MKVSTSTIQQLNSEYNSGPDPLEDGLKTLLKRIGEQLGAVEEVIEWGPRYDGIVVAKVISCVPHSNSDHLHVCLIDDGGVVKGVKRIDWPQDMRADAVSISERVAEKGVRKSTSIEQRSEEVGNAQQTSRVSGSARKQVGRSHGLVQVVCGAPNVKAGQTVVWLPPGITVPSSIDKDPFVLETRNIRGIDSNGMIASAAELGISDNHDGILVIEESEVGKDLIKPGTEFKKLYGLDDIIIDIENKMFTHRPDCFGQLGVARELAGIAGKPFNSPDWYKKASVDKPGSKTLPLKVTNPVKDVVPRFMAQVVSGIEIKASPIWLQAYLTRIGSKSINNIVDLTNYFMTITAQPLHAFDYDKIKARSGSSPSLGPRLAKKGEKLTLLGGKTIELLPTDIVIATDKLPVALAGIMGGADTEVDDSTKNIILECATFDMFTVRRSSMHHGLFTDAATRYTKGQSPHQNDKVLAKIVEEILKSIDSAKAGAIFDEGAQPPKPKAVLVSPEFINERLGSELSITDMAELLENVEFKVGLKKNELEILPPFWRMDIEQPEDIVEEIGRLQGFDSIPQLLPTKTAKAAERDPELDKKQALRELLAAAGANEVLTYSFVPADLLEKSGQDPKLAFHIRNALSPELQHYHISLSPSLLEKIHPNIKSDLIRSDDNEFALFEINKVHMKGIEGIEERKVPQEDMHLCLVVAADDKTAKRKYSGSAYFLAKNYLSQLVRSASVDLVPLAGYKFGPDTWAEQMCAPYEPKRSGLYVVNGMVWGVVGEYRSSVKKALKLPEFCAGFEIGLDKIDVSVKTYTELSMFPKMQQDITFKVSANTKFVEIRNSISEQLDRAQSKHGYFGALAPRDIFASDKKHLNYTFRIWLSHHKRTLTTKEVNDLLDEIAQNLKKSLKSERI